MTYREVIYYCLDAIKSSNGDSSITEEHVIFLTNQYRVFLLEQKKRKDGEHSLSSTNEQTICIDLEQVDAIPGLEYCNDIYVRSKQEIPNALNTDTMKVSLADMFNIMTAYVSQERFRYVGYNKYLKNIIYCTLGPDNHLYFNAQNPQFRYLKQAKITGIFEDAQKAAELACDSDTNSTCDIMDQDFPLQSDLIPQLLELSVKELLGINYRPKDDYNNSSDDLADIAAFIRRNMKSNIAKQIQS